MSWAGFWCVTVAISDHISYNGLVTVDNMCFVIPLSNKRHHLSTLAHKWFDLPLCELSLSLNEYEGCSNMNASGFITFFTYMLRQSGKRFYKGLYVTFKVALDQKKNTVNLSSYSPLNEGHVCILTNSMLRTSTSDRDERINLRRTGEIS